jgi:hypothetical protein
LGKGYVERTGTIDRCCGQIFLLDRFDDSDNRQHAIAKARHLLSQWASIRPEVSGKLLIEHDH